nr:hypothetical protein [Nostoc sp. CHAB 5715]
MVENIRRFIHLHHERRLTSCKIIYCTYTGENAIAYSQSGKPSWYKTTNLRH